LATLFPPSVVIPLLPTLPLSKRVRRGRSVVFAIPDVASIRLCNDQLSLLLRLVSKSKIGVIAPIPSTLNVRCGYRLLETRNVRET
jgi:hypothetical protein